MLRDISSIANAYGGYLIIGIEEDGNGIPTKPFNIDNAEVERNRIEQSCLSSIEHRISGLKSKTVKMDTREEVIIVFIPRSLKKPHMVTFSDLNQFWIRHNDKKQLMSVEEIRDACISVENIWKDVKQFLGEREKALRAGILSRGGMVIGSAPVPTRGEYIDIRHSSIQSFLIEPPDQIKGQYTLSFKPWGAEEAFPEPTLDGLKIYVSDWMYIELHRNGYYELIIPQNMFTFERGGKDCIHHQKIITFTVNYFRALAHLMELFGIEQTVVAFMSFFNVGGITLEHAKIIPGTKYAKQVDSKWALRDLKLPPKQIFSLSNPDKEAKYFLDRLWNAFGFEEVPQFKDEKYSP